MADSPPQTGTLGSTRPGWSTKKKEGQNASNRGKMNPVVDEENWRQKMKRRGLKFDDEQKQIFLDTLARTGLKYTSYEAADVTRNCVMGHAERDPEFADQMDAALGEYREKVRQEVWNRGVIGWEEPVYGGGKRVLEPLTDPETGEVLRDENGEIRLRSATVLKKSDRLLELEAKRVDPAYRDKGLLGEMEGSGVKKIVVEFVDPEPDPQIIENETPLPLEDKTAD